MDIDDFFSFGNHGASKVDARSTTTKHHEFFRFLSMSLSLKVPILPLMWRPSLESLGEGATGHVSQASLNKRQLLAFKRFAAWRPQRGVSKAQFRSAQYEAFISEMLALQHSPLANHPNIVKLKGLCWEVTDNENEVLPVLVFDQAQFDLEQFLSLPESVEYGIEDRMFILGDISDAICALHSSGIVHGDIKPRNILTFRSDSDPNAVRFKLTDFGYSCLGSKESDLVVLPQSIPWDAPEYHDRAFTLGHAKKTDVYSFGLLCLWIIFHNDHLSSDLCLDISIISAFCGSNSNMQSHLEALKQSGQLLDSVLHLISTKSNLTIDTQTVLHEVFKRSLVRNPLQRETGMDFFKQLLSVHDEYGRKTDEPISDVLIPEWHESLKIEDIFYELEACDYRVHRYISAQFKAASEINSDNECTTCSRNAAFQAAMSLSFGFGTDRDVEAASRYLEKGGKTLNDIHNALQRIRRSGTSVGIMMSLIGLGYQNHLADDYIADGVVTEAILEYKSMVSAREAAFGLTHFSTMRIRTILADILDKNSDRETAAILREITLKQYQNHSPNRARDLSISILKNTLAENYRGLSRFDDAERLWLEVLEEYQSKAYESDTIPHFLHLLVLSGLSRASFGKSDYQMAMERGVQAVRESEEYLGPDHINTMSSKYVLARAKWKAGEIQPAVKLMDDVVQSQQRVLGPMNHYTVDSAESLSCMHIELGNMGEANQIFDRFLDPVIARLDQLPNMFLHIGRYYAVALAAAGQLDNAKLIQYRRLALCKNRLGPNHPLTVDTMSDLAVTYLKHRELEKAEALGQPVLEFFRQKKGPHHKDTLLAMRNHSDTLFHMKKWREAAQLCLEELQYREDLSQDPNQGMLVAVEKLSRALIELGRWNDAQKFLEKEIMWRTGSSTEHDAFIMETIALVALSSLHTESRDIARKWLAKLFENVLDGLVVETSTFLPALYRLELRCEEVGWLEEAEQLLTLALIFRKRHGIDVGKEIDQEQIIRLHHLLEMQGKSDVEGVVFNPRAIIERGRALEN